VKLAGLWSDSLLIETDKIGIDDDFFDLGGHSLKATILVSAIHKAFNIKIPLAEVFRTPTIRGLSQYIAAAGEDEYISIEAAEKKEYYELSSVQKRLYILQQMVPETTPYNITLTVPIDTVMEIDRERLEKTFKRLVERHESLRTSFPMIGKRPVQKVHDEVEFKIEYYDLAAKAVARHPKTKDREDIIENFIRPFDLSCAPLLRVGLLEIGKEKHILMVDMHHIITDGASEKLFAREFMRLYIDEGEGLSPLKIQYKDYALWNR
jgi:acyl carrier protein